MKIDPVSNYRIFGKTNPAMGAKTPQAPERASKADVLDFSRAQAAPSDKALAALRTGVLRGVSRPASPETLAGLGEQIREGSYRRSTEELADAILDQTGAKE